MTTLLGPRPTTGPSVLMFCSLSCIPMPWKPVSVAPTESVKTALVNTSIQRFLTSGLKIAALLEIANRLDPSYGVPVAALRSYSSISGRAIASPVMKISWTLSLVDDLPGALRVELRLEDRQVAGEQVHQQPGLGAAVHQRAQREGDHPRVGRLRWTGSNSSSGSPV